MQKKLIALAIASLSGAAFAQSNVTIYGVADATFDIVNVSGGSAPAAGSLGVLSNNVGPTFDTPNYTRVSTNGSHIGFKGMESLGNGMVAVFQYESAVNFDAAGTFGASRDSYIGLAGGFGTVVMGNLTGPTRALANALDVNAGTNDSIASNRALLGKMGGVLAGATANGNSLLGVTAAGSTAGPLGAQARSVSGASVFDSYLPNVIAYVSPSFSGFQATVGYLTNEGKTDISGAKLNTSAYDTGLTYANGPIWVGLTYGNIQLRNDFSIAGLGTDIKTNETRLGGKYDFGNASVRLLWSRNKTETSALDLSQNVWGVGGTFNVTANGKITGQYYRAQDVSGSAPVSLTNTGAKFYSLGYEHSLSKRTMLKANYAYLKNDDNSIGYDFGNSTTGLAGPGVKLSGFQIGLRHSF